MPSKHTNVYKIYTENKNYSDVIDAVRQYINSFTVLTGEGYFNGVKEHCMVIEIVVEEFVDALETGSLLYAIKQAGGQQCVMMTYTDVTVVTC